MSGPAPFGSRGSQPADLGRLIPGENPPLPDKKKPPQAVKSVAFVADQVVEILPEEPATEASLAMLLPSPLQSRSAQRWLRSTAADFALVGLNWLLLAALRSPLRTLFPRWQAAGFAWGSPVSLLGIALLQAALITLMIYTEGLYAGVTNLRDQARILGKSVFWVTGLLCLAYFLQGASPATCLLFLALGLLHFAALWGWRWQSQGWRRWSAASADTCNVLIVGAGNVGRRIAAFVEAHPEAGRTVCGFLDNERPLGNQVIGRVSDLARLARTGFVDEVILAAPQDRALTLQVLREAQRLRLDLEIVPELFGCTPAAPEVEQVGNLPVICLHAERLPAAALVTKRLVDVIGSGTALLVLSPLFAAIGLLISWTRPALFSTVRCGRGGRRGRSVATNSAPWGRTPTHSKTSYGRATSDQAPSSKSQRIRGSPVSDACCVATAWMSFLNSGMC